MRMIIISVTFRTDRLDKTYDLEMPCHVPFRTIDKQMRQTIQEYSGKAPFPNARLYSQRLNRFLDSNETADTAGIWNGDLLEFK